MFDVLMVTMSVVFGVFGGLAYLGIWRSWARVENGRMEGWRWEMRNFPVAAPWLGGGVLTIYILSALQVRKGIPVLLYFLAIGGMGVATVMAHYIPRFLYPKWIRRSHSGDDRQGGY